MDNRAVGAVITLRVPSAATPKKARAEIKLGCS